MDKMFSVIMHNVFKYMEQVNREFATKENKLREQEQEYGIDIDDDDYWYV